ncbi:unnamed protein product [Rhodiola kirilowii]
MDFITHLPPSKGFTGVLVVVDRLSQYVHFSPLKVGFTAEDVAHLFVKDITRLHGFPRSIVSDRDLLFMSRFWKEFFKLHKTNLATSSAYHPQMDGQTEIVNRALEDYLRCFVSENQSDWVDHLPWAEYSHNTAVHASIGITPFEAVYGRTPPDLLDHVQGATPLHTVDTLLDKRTTLLRQLRTNMERAQNRMRQQANSHRKDKEFMVGDWVYVRIQPYRQVSLRQRRMTKLAKQFYGPFLITDRIGKVAYRLQLPDNARIHNVFHVSILRKCLDPSTAAVHEFPLQFVDNNPAIALEAVLATRKIKVSNGWDDQVLIKWSDQPQEDASWESLSSVRNDFLAFDLADKVHLHGGSIVTKPSGPRNIRLSKGVHKRTIAGQTDTEPQATGPAALPELLEKRKRTVPARYNPDLYVT